MPYAVMSPRCLPSCQILHILISPKYLPHYQMLYMSELLASCQMPCAVCHQVVCLLPDTQRSNLTESFTLPSDVVYRNVTKLFAFCQMPCAVCHQVVCLLPDTQHFNLTESFTLPSDVVYRNVTTLFASCQMPCAAGGGPEVCVQPDNQVFPSVAREAVCRQRSR